MSLNGYFLQYPLTGSGQYLKHLAESLKQLSPRDEFRIAPYGQGYSCVGRRLGKVLWEQAGFPAYSATADLRHDPYMASSFLRCADIMTVHDLIGFVVSGYETSAWVRIYNRMAAASVRRARLILADSQATAADLERVLGISENRIRVIPLGVSEHLAPVPTHMETAICDRYNLPARFVLYLGSGDKRKNLDLLLKSWSLMPKVERVPLVLAGDIPCAGTELFPDYRLLARQLDVDSSVIWLGPISEGDKAALLSAAAIFVFPSLYEGFGLEPLEAMACGTPVVCSDATSLPEVVGDAAALVDPLNPSAWASSIHELLTNSVTAAHLSESGLVRAAQMTWNETAVATLAAYRELL